MTPNISTKAAMRQAMLTRLRQLQPQERQAAAMGIVGALKQLWATSPPHVVGSFASLPSEIDTTPLHQWFNEQHIACYTSDHTHTAAVIFSCDPSLLDVILVPGLAFDHHGHRLGRGKGCYDRFLEQMKQLPHPPLLIGLAYDFQIIEALPIEQHDQKVDMLCTPTKITRL